MLSSPLRYPGGKAKLFSFVADIISQNSLFGAVYSEPYCGGAGLALRLLSSGFVKSIAINDVDPAIYALWRAILNKSDDFCERVLSTPITVEEWHKQKEIWQRCDKRKYLDLGFATYFLNRTNRSGIIGNAGPIGGFSQLGSWKIDARLVKNKQIENIKRIQNFRDQIEISNSDALDFVKTCFKRANTFVYLDPPYYFKGNKLYTNFYKHEDHLKLHEYLDKMKDRRWIVSYDDVPEVRAIYKKYIPVKYVLQYSIGSRTTGSEVMYCSDALQVPSSRTLRSAA